MSASQSVSSCSHLKCGVLWRASNCRAHSPQNGHMTASLIAVFMCCSRSRRQRCHNARRGITDSHVHVPFMSGAKGTSASRKSAPACQPAQEIPSHDMIHQFCKQQSPQLTISCSSVSFSVIIQNHCHVSFTFVIYVKTYSVSVCAEQQRASAVVCSSTSRRLAGCIEPGTRFSAGWACKRTAAVCLESQRAWIGGRASSFSECRN